MKLEKQTGWSRAYQPEALKFGALSCSSDGVELRVLYCSAVPCKYSRLVQEVMAIEYKEDPHRSRWVWCMLLILALRKAEAGRSVSSRQAWFTRTSSRTGFKNTEKLCLNKPKKKEKRIPSCTCAQTSNKAASNHQNMVNSDIVDSLMFRCLDF